MLIQKVLRINKVASKSTMILNRANALLLAVLFVTGFGTVNAAFVHDLAVNGNFSGTGQITLNTITGTDATGIDAFDFTVNSSGGGLPAPATFGLGDINSVSWTSADSVLSLILRTNLVDQSGTLVSLVLKEDNNNFFDDLCGAIGSNSGSTYCRSGLLVGGSTLTTTAVSPPSAVPVPAAVWLFGTALIGLVGFGKRRKAA
jgi:hypothetical protein